ncbi:hypothetical protein [Cupriavidus necator]
MQGPVPWGGGTAARTPPNLEMFLGLPGIGRPLQPVRTPQAGPGLNLVRVTGTRRLVATRRRDAVASEVHQEPSAKHSFIFGSIRLDGEVHPLPVVGRFGECIEKEFGIFNSSGLMKESAC